MSLVVDLTTGDVHLTRPVTRIGDRLDRVGARLDPSWGHRDDHHAHLQKIKFPARAVPSRGFRVSSSRPGRGLFAGTPVSLRSPAPMGVPADLSPRRQPTTEPDERTDGRCGVDVSPARRTPMRRAAE